MRGKKVLAPLALGAAMAVSAAPAQAQIAQPAGAIKNMELIGNLPEAANSTAINFMTYGRSASAGHGRGTGCGTGAIEQGPRPGKETT